MLSLSRMSAFHAKPAERFAWRRVPPRHSSASTQTHLARNAETSRDTQLRIDVGSKIHLNRRNHLKKILERHKIELQKAFDLQESPLIALTLPRTFKFEGEVEEDGSEPQRLQEAAKKAKTPHLSAMELERRKSKDRQAKQVSYAAQRKLVIASLRSYVDVCVQVGQYELGLQALNYYRWFLRRLHQRLSVVSPQPYPVDIYNTVLSGCASSGNFKVASEVKQLMSWDNINLDASSYAYLIAAAKGKDDILGIVKSMSAARIPLNDLFLKTALTEDQLKKLLVNVRKCDDNRNFEVPRFVFPQNRTCALISDLRDARKPHRQTQMQDVDLFREKAIEQKKRELAGTVEVKSVAAVEKPTERVTFLRQQVARCENDWRKTLKIIFDTRLEAATNQALHLHEMSVYPYLLALDKSIFIELMVQEMRSHALASESFSMGSSYLAAQLGAKVEQLYHIQSKVKRGVLKTQDRIYDEYLTIFDPRHTTPTRELWQSLITKNSSLGPCFENHRNCPWPFGTKTSVGVFLYSLLRLLKVNVNILQPNCGRREMMNALYSVYRTSEERTKEELKAHRVLTTLYTKADLEELHFDATQVPMLCPPKPWCHPESSPYLAASTQCIRVPQDCGDLQMNLIKSRPVETLYPTLDALNTLTRTPWKVNKPVLEVMTSVFLGDGDENLSIPRHPDKLVPPDLTSIRAKSKSKGALRAEFLAFRREKAETFSLWCEMHYKLSIAHHFKDEIFFFPHNMDFRGRVYPVPPHFQHLGGDPVRGLLLFGEGMPLGKEGLWWLKLHLINLTGSMKRKPIEERVRYADDILDDIIDSAKNPLNGRKWWQKSDDPWQTLATCIEIANAVESPDPEKYICHLPIHQDGSCNGLQHYAALGRDQEGALQVNLIPKLKPQDVYSGIADVVEQIREADSKQGLEIAKDLEGHITRKVVKQTVMTIVYGVTRYGAQQQILNRLEDRPNFPQKKARMAATYLVGAVFTSLAKMFTSSRQIQSWFAECARSVVMATNQPVRWTTPLGLPVVQPYFKKVSRKAPIKCDMMNIQLTIPTSVACRVKQRNGFPPNFIHSLDSSHMMLTAIYSEAAGINFVSVHDCYWTHASSVEEMNRICREQFVALHSQPILQNLSKELQQTYCNPKLLRSDVKVTLKTFQDTLKRVPSKGNFDLNHVLKSTYFFS